MVFKKTAKTGYLSKNGEICNQKRSKGGQHFLSQLKLTLSCFKQKTWFKNENWQTSTNGKKMVKKRSKTSICQHKQCILTQKGPKWPKRKLPWTQNNCQMIQSNLIKFLANLHGILISSFQENSQKTWFLEQIGQILEQKRSKNYQKIFCHNSNLLYLILNHKLGLKNKNC